MNWERMSTRQTLGCLAIVVIVSFGGVAALIAMWLL